MSEFMKCLTVHVSFGSRYAPFIPSLRSLTSRVAVRRSTMETARETRGRWMRRSQPTIVTVSISLRPLSFPSLRSFHSSRAEGAEWKEATRAVGFLTPYDRSSLAPAVWSGPVRHGHPLPCLRRRTGSRPTAPRGMEWVRRATVRSEPTWT